MQKLTYTPIGAEYVNKIRNSAEDGSGHALVPRTLKHRALCRHCLADGSLDTPQILFSYRPLPEDATAYSETGPVFVHTHCKQYTDLHTFPPDIATRRFLTLRAYSKKQWMLKGMMSEGASAEQNLLEFFSDPETETVLISDASTGCFFVRVDRG